MIARWLAGPKAAHKGAAARKGSFCWGSGSNMGFACRYDVAVSRLQSLSLSNDPLSRAECVIAATRITLILLGLVHFGKRLLRRGLPTPKSLRAERR
jgi:hypothetical protein